MNERTFTARSAADLIQSMQGLTGIEMDRIAKPHIGKWLKAEGSIHNIHAARRYGYFVSMQNVQGRGELVMLFEQDTETGIIEILIRGDRLTAQCRMRDIDHHAIHLENCEVIDIVSARTEQKDP